VTRDGHDFIDWSLDDKPFTLNKKLVKFPAAVSADTTYYAYWCKKDTFNQQFALRDSLTAFNDYAWNNYVLKNNYDIGDDGFGKGSLTDKDSAELTPVFKEAYLDGFFRDKYFENLPFGSVAMYRRFAPLKVFFGYNGIGGSADHNPLLLTTTITGPQLEVYLAYSTAIHEVGHILGLGERLTELLMGLSIAELRRYTSAMYDPRIDYMLLKKVGDKTFWETVFMSPDPLEAYYKMWDDNMTVVVNGHREPLVTGSDWTLVAILSFPDYSNIDEEAADREVMRITGMTLKEFLGQGFAENGTGFCHAFEMALNNNDPIAIEYVRYRVRVTKEVLALCPPLPTSVPYRQAILPHIQDFQKCM